MARDSSYAEYVDMRWAMLYRLASLLVGEDRAQDVTARTLARAFLVWADVGEAASADEHLEEMLARKAIEEPVTGSEDDGLEGLPTRQRAAVVLRVIALLSDHEIARALRCPTSDVEAQVSGALGRLGLSLPQLTADLERRSEEVGVPPPPIESLLSLGHAERRRRRRRILTRMVATAAVVVAVLAVTALVQGVESAIHRRSVTPIPATLARLAAGPRPRTAYLEGRTLHLAGGRSVELTGQPDTVLQAAQWVYLGYRSGTIERLHTVSLATATLTTTSTGQLVTDPSGRYVAWVEARPGRRRPPVVALVTGPRGETLRQHVHAFPAGADPFVLVGLDRNGDVFGSRPTVKDGTWVWRTGMIPAPGRRDFDRISGLGNGTAVQVNRGQVVVQYPGWYAVGPLDGSGVVFDEEVPGTIADFADPAGRRAAYVVDGHAFVVERTRAGSSRPGHERRLRLPARADVVGLRWEDAGHLLVDVRDPSVPHGALARCDVRTADCELAVVFTGPHLLAREG